MKTNLKGLLAASGSKFITRSVARFSILLLSCLLSASMGWGQTTLISPTADGGFETGSTFAANGWTTVNPSTDQWSIGSVPVVSAGTNCAYVSSNGGVAWTYSEISIFNHMYRDVTIPSGETSITLSFKWKANGEGTATSDWDNLKIFWGATSIAPTSTTAVSGATQLSGPGAISGMYKLSSASWNSETITFTAAPGTYRLFFQWKSDSYDIANPPAALDEISLISATPASYTWNATTGSASWATATSWTPSRTTPDASDILNFSNGGSSIVQTASGAIGGNIVFSNNTTANFQPTSANTLTLNSLTIPSGSSMFLNGTTAQTLAFASGAVNTINGLFEISNTTGVNVLNLSGTVTTVGSTGTLAAGGIVTTTAWSGSSTTTLIINGSYEHKYTTANGTIPTATWSLNSNCNIIGYTATSMVPSGIAQTFGNFTWNCSGQAANNYNLASTSTTTILGTLSIVSTGTTGSLSWTGTGSYILNVNNYSQSGGIFDLSSGVSGASMTMNVSGTFNQTGGTFLSSGTTTNNPTLHFNGTTNQIVTFTTQPTGPITYRISNPNGITLTGPSTNFNIGNGTLGGLRISTTGSTPITFGGSTSALSYNAANSTLTYDATTGNTTARDVEFPATNGPTNLIVAVGSGNVLSVPFARTISGILTMTSGDIDISSNNLTLGTSSSALGTLTWTAGSIRVTTGTLTRWFGTSGLPIAAGTAIGYFPLASISNNRNVSVYFSSTSALSSGGTITIGHTNVAGLSTITSFLDAGYNIDTRTNSNWTISTGNGIAATTGTLGVRLTGGRAFSTPTVANIRVIQASAADGTHTSGTGSTPNFQASRTGLTLAQIANTHYIGAASADMQTAFNSVASGDWNNSNTWDVGSVPTCNGVVNILNGHNVTVNSSSNVSKNLTINSGGTLTVASGDLTVGCTLNNTPLTNNGTLTVSGGTLNVNGNINLVAASTFNMSGSSQIKIDGNGNSTASSVPAGTRIFQVSSNLGAVNGGTITIVDPHFDLATTQTFGYSVSTLNWAWNGNTLILGDGSSTDASSSTRGFELDCYASSGLLVLGNIIVNGGSATNRFTTTANATANGTFLTNLTINSTSEFRNTAATYFFVQGDITNNGTLTIPNSIVLGTPSGVAVANSQTISGSGVFRNATSTPTANLGTLLVNNSNATGVTISVPISISGTLTMTAGKINTTATNLLTLGTSTAAGTLNYTAGQIVGPFARTFATSSTSTASYGATTLFPVGDGTNYTPIHIDPVNGAGPVVMRGQAFNTNAGTSNFCTLSSNRWEALPSSGSGNLSNCFVGIYDPSIVNSSSSIIVQSTSSSGTYNTISPNSTYIAASSPTPNGLRTATSLSSAAFSGYFAYASQNRWSGAVSTDWNNSGNWSCATVPGSSDNVVIPTTGITYYPSLSGATAIKDINIGSGTLSLNGQTLTINGAVSGAGTIKGSATSSLSFTGTTNNTLKMDQTTVGTTNVLKNLTLSGTGTTTLGNALNITTGATPGVLTVNPGATLNTGGFLTLKSDATGTARVANSAGTISGEVSVERYIPQNTNRAWRALAVPTYSASQTIANSWQLGTLITGPGGANGLDQATGGFSMMSYNPTSDLLVGVGNMTSVISNNTAAPAAYYLYVRGDRTVGVANTNLNPSATTLSTKGSLYQGTVTVPAANNGSGTTYHLVGNPYVSPINLNNFYTANSSNIDNTFYVWDPKIANTAAGVGGLITLTGSGSSSSYTPSVTGASYNGNISEIPSGMAFYITKSSGSASSIVFNEGMKTTGSTIANGYNGLKTTAAVDGQLQVNLNVKINDSTVRPADGILAIFDANEKVQIDGADARKMSNFGENMAINNQGYLLAIEKRPLFTQDTLHINTTGLTNRLYSLRFNPSQFQNASSALLIDHYTNSTQSIPLQSVSEYAFTIDANAQSKGPNRFDVVFEQAALQIATTKKLMAIELYPNPVSEGVINISMHQQKEGSYTVAIVNALGAEIQKENWHHSNGDQIHSINVNKLASGIYYLKISNEFGDQSMHKFIQSSSNF